MPQFNDEQFYQYPPFNRNRAWHAKHDYDVPVVSSVGNGPKGDKGDKGDPGDQGPQGPKGDKMTFQDLTQDDIAVIGDYVIDCGVRGPKGDKGDKGDRGNGLESVTYDDGVVTFMDDDGNTYSTGDIKLDYADLTTAEKQEMYMGMSMDILADKFSTEWDMDTTVITRPMTIESMPYDGIAIWFDYDKTALIVMSKSQVKNWYDQTTTSPLYSDFINEVEWNNDQEEWSARTENGVWLEDPIKMSVATVAATTYEAAMQWKAGHAGYLFVTPDRYETRGQDEQFIHGYFTIEEKYPIPAYSNYMPFMNGLILSPNDYTISDGYISFSSSLAEDDVQILCLTCNTRIDPREARVHKASIPTDMIEYQESTTLVFSASAFGLTSLDGCTVLSVYQTEYDSGEYAGRVTDTPKWRKNSPTANSIVVETKNDSAYSSRSKFLVTIEIMEA